MTEFRTKGKGKERKVYPIKKAPYGITRELAQKDVEFLRAGGSRVRLINTNRKLHLYAPYASALEINREAKEEEREAGQKPISMPKGTGETGKEIPSTADIRSVWDVKKAQEKYDLQDPTILNVDGKSLLTVVDKAHVMMGWKDLPTPVDSAAVSEFNGMRKALRIPALDYSEGASEITMGKREISNLKMLSRELVKELRSDSTTPSHRRSRFGPGDLEIVFTKPEPGKYGYAVVLLEDKYKAPDSQKDYAHVMRVEMSNMTPGEKVAYSSTYFMDSVKLFDDIRGVRPDRNTHYRISVKPDYPLLVSEGSPAGRRITDLPDGVVLAPRMEDSRNDERIQKAIKRLTGDQGGK